MRTDGTVSTWVEETAITTNVNLYHYPANYSVTGGGAALKTQILAHGGGAPGAPTVYEIADSMTYDAGIDLTNVNNIVIRGAVAERPVIAVGVSGDTGIQIQYTAVIHGTTDDVTIGNITFDNTLAGSGAQHCIFFERQAGALVTDTIGTVGIKDVLCVNTDYATVGISRGALVTIDLQGDGGFWISNLYLERAVFRDQTPRDDRGAPQLMGIQNYIGKYNAFLYPGLTTFGADIASRYYWVRGSNVREQYSYFSHACYSGNAVSNRFMVWISQDYLYSSWANTCTIEFENCSFANAIEAQYGAIALKHKPDFTPGAALAPITLNVNNCQFMNDAGQGVIIYGDTVVHPLARVSLNVTDSTFINCDCGVKQDASYVSGYDSLIVERNTYDRCDVVDNGFSTPIQQSVAPNLNCMAGMYQYTDLVDYTLWTVSSAAYFVSTATFSPGSGWFTIDFTSGLPATGWVDSGITANCTVNTATGVITVEDDGLFQIDYALCLTNPEAAKTMFETYVSVGADVPPAAGPTTATQRYRISPMLQLSTAATEPTTYRNKLFVRMTKGETVSLAVRWAASDPVAGGPQSFYIQSARLDVMRVGL